MHPMKYISIYEGQLLLLKAALNNNRNIALNAWKKWGKNSSIETAPDSELRILPSVYNNILKLSPSTSLPIKINGQMKHIYTKNYLHLDVALKLSELFKKKNINIIFGKGINICQRFNLFSTRRMHDIDFYVNENQVIKACNILEKDSWILSGPMQMTWDCLTSRFLTRGKSINVTKNYNGIDVQIDLHWRLYTTEKNSELYKRKINMAEATKIKNQIIYLDNIEFATLNSIEHGIFTGVDSSDQSQMILDLAKLLPASNKKKLLNLLNKSSFLKYNKNVSLFFTELKSIYKKIGLDIKVPKVRINLLNNILFIINNIFRNDNHKVSTFNNFFLRRIITDIKLILFSENEKSLLNYPLKYFFWRILSHSSFFEKLLIKFYGPISKTNNPNKIILNSYSFYKCSIIKLVGGPGWSHPFKTQKDNGFWEDRTDCRLLFFLKEKKEYKISILLSKLQENPLYFNIKVYANGFYLGKISDNFGSKDFIINKNLLIGKWVEISLRTNLINNNLTIPLHKINLKRN